MTKIQRKALELIAVNDHAYRGWQADPSRSWVVQVKGQKAEFIPNRLIDALKKQGLISISERRDWFFVRLTDSGKAMLNS